MSLVIPPGFYEVAFTHSLTGSLHESVCTIGVKYNGADFANDAVKMQHGWSFIVGEMNEAWALTGYKFSVQEGTVIDASIIPPSQGGRSGPCAPAHETFLLEKRSARPGRMGRGRMYVPGVGEDVTDQLGIVNEAKRTLLQTALNNATVEWASGHFSLYILHNTNPDKPGLDTTPTPLTDIAFSHQIATQRRRMPRI